ncbi:MAG: phosphonate C-P lyase system protein PhnG [Acidobacteria bacterium]|nr:phosphonate C-P lyase system protein PhnG [Acidobacteriota bacterium]
MPLEATQQQRRRWMSALAKAPETDLRQAWQALRLQPAYQVLRKPEIGLTMVRGRAGGDGAPFHLGEMTVTRCSVALDDGTVGHAYVSGRRPWHAETAAVCDALLQSSPDLIGPLIEPLEKAQAERRRAARAKAEATRAEFFTMVRGE